MRIFLNLSFICLFIICTSSCTTNFYNRSNSFDNNQVTELSNNQLEDTFQLITSEELIRFKEKEEIQKINVDLIKKQLYKRNTEREYYYSLAELFNNICSTYNFKKHELKDCLGKGTCPNLIKLNQIRKTINPEISNQLHFIYDELVNYYQFDTKKYDFSYFMHNSSDIITFIQHINLKEEKADYAILKKELSKLVEIQDKISISLKELKN